MRSQTPPIQPTDLTKRRLTSGLALSTPPNPPLTALSLANRLLLEDLVPFVAVAQKMRVHISAPHRWRRRKPPAPSLEAIRVLGKWMTSWQAVDRFVTALNSAPNPPAPPATAGGRPSAVIERQLDAEGL